MAIHVSVCMATHNGASYIIEQIESILDQLSPNDELVISDDASTDDTVQIIRQLKDARVKYVGSQFYGSPSLNFENALQNASGQYIFLADQDDIWASNKIEVVLPFLQNYDLVLTDCELMDKGGDLIYPSFFEIRGSKAGFWNNLRKNSYMGCCMAFRRESLLYALPFPADIHMHDWWIGLLVEARGRVFFLRQPLMRYRRHGANASPTGEGTNYSLWKQISNRTMMIILIAHRLLTKA